MPVLPIDLVVSAKINWIETLNVPNLAHSQNDLLVWKALLDKTVLKRALEAENSLVRGNLCTREKGYLLLCAH